MKRMDVIARYAPICDPIGNHKSNRSIEPGSISFRAGSNYFFRAITHDPMYDAYWIGFLCCYLTFCECIVREAKELHFMWGDCEYKYSPPGVKRDLDKVAVYRSNWQMLCKGDIALKIAFKGCLHQLMQWSHSAKRRNGLVPQPAITSLKDLRNMEHRSQAIVAKRK